MRLRLENGNAAKLTGFRYFWLKRVDRFDDAVHCARCLVGAYVKGLGADMPAGVDIDVPAEPGQVFYLCGVSAPYRWANNAHLALRVSPGATCTLTLYTGATITVHGAVALAFDDAPAREQYPDRGQAFLTCRNFQFGAALDRGAVQPIE